MHIKLCVILTFVPENMRTQPSAHAVARMDPQVWNLTSKAGVAVPERTKSLVCTV